LFYPGLIEFISRLTWFCPQAFYYFQSGDIYKCADAQILHIYYIGFLCTMAAIIPIQLLIVIISAQGTITNTKPRRHMNKFLFIRMLLILFEISWSIVGTVWIASIKMGSCSPIIYWTVVLNLVFCGIAVFFLIIVVLFVFDPLSHLDQNDVTQKRNVIEYYLNKLCCCFACCLDSGPKSRESYANSYKQISRLLEMLFSKADLTPSDIAAGVMLINNKTLPQLPREFHRHTTCRKTNISQIPAWMNINAASHFIRYALATYSWPYYLYLHNMGGFCDVCCFGGDLRDNESGRCCFCCCDGRKTNVIEDQPEIGFPAGNFILVGDTKSRRNLRAFKYLAQCEECDIIYANFTNEAFLSPFCVVVDHFKKTVIITIRGTLSMR
jgi:sn1-specific diacylglycerol lipase